MEGTLCGQEGVDGILPGLSEAELSRGAAREEPELETVMSCSSSEKPEKLREERREVERAGGGGEGPLAWSWDRRCLTGRAREERMV